MSNPAEVEVTDTRKSPEEIVYAIMEALGQDQQFTDEVAHTINSNWETTWKYLKLIQYVQECPKIVTARIGNKRTWKREWGRLPE